MKGIIHFLCRVVYANRGRVTWSLTLAQKGPKTLKRLVPFIWPDVFTQAKRFYLGLSAQTLLLRQMSGPDKKLKICLA